MKFLSTLGFLIITVFFINVAIGMPEGIKEQTHKEQHVVEKQKICVTQECNNTASRILGHMDNNVDPCDNFYKFSCGKFLNDVVIPDDKNVIDSFSRITDEVRVQLRQIIEKESKPTDPRFVKLVKNFYKSCMNETVIEKLGLKPLHQILNKLGGWPVVLGDKWNENDFHWVESFNKFRKFGFYLDFYITFHIYADIKNNTRNVIILDQTDFGISRESLVQGRGEKYVEEYYSYMVDVAKILGADENKASKELKESLDFEIKLAKISQPPENLRNFTALYNLMTIRDLSQKFPSIPWLKYINTILGIKPNITETEPVVISVPSFIAELENLLRETPKRVQANYLMWRAIKNIIFSLNNEIREREFIFDKIISGKIKREPRWEECVDEVSTRFPISVGSLYVRKYFKEEAKTKMVQMVSDIIQEMKNILQQLEWMDKETMKAAVKKIDSMLINVAYPIELLNDTRMEEYHLGAEISPEYYFENILNATIFDTEDRFMKLRLPVSKNDWKNFGDPHIVNAYYTDLSNSIGLPAGILQGSFFSNDRPNYVNYAAIGYVIGHEVTHGFDDQGSQYDKDGILIDWWQENTKNKYLNLTECIVEQYGNYAVPEVNLKLNGINTQGENIADNAGIKIAYLAYNKWASQHEAELKLLGFEKYTPQQMFWISAANSRCAKYRPEYLRDNVKTDEHSPEEFRVLGPMSNMPEFAKDFGCKLGSKMNPEKKCTVW